MRCEDVDKIVILALVLNVIVDILELWAELTNQRCEKVTKKEETEKENKLNAELVDLRKRIELLEK